ncbi:MAG: OmpH family outer membrane protein [Candidatus Stahlbacteria bacterium]|nr:OmpH family outer membrane protein [Candidatus Stahlbacteria bacterium]
MKRYIWLGLFLPLVVMADVKIGYIDSNRLLEKYKGREELKSKLERELTKWQEDAIKRKQKVESLIKEFENQSAMLSEEARARKRQEIEKLQAEYEQFVQEIYAPDGLAKKRNDEIMKPFIEKVNLLLQKIGKDRGYTIILDATSSGLVYVKEGMDLTDEVVAELNQEFAPVTTASDTVSGKPYCWVFKFKEQTSEAREWKLGQTIAQYVMAGLVGNDIFKQVLSSKLTNAMKEANIPNKTEDEYTAEEAGRIGKLADASVVIIGEVTKVGDKVDITCKVVDTLTGMVVAEEIGSSIGTETGNINTMVGEVLSKLRPKIITK